MSWKNNERFNQIYPHVLYVEGGYVWDKRDSGGATNHGIAFNYNRGYLKKFGITSPTQMRSLTKDQAIEIYYRRYWLPSQADEIPDKKLAFVYFDHVVNAGQSVADKLLGKIDHRFWYIEGDGANIDFFWGMTIQYMLQRLYWYVNIRQWNRYGLGWFRRLLKISKKLPNLGK